MKFCRHIILSFILLFASFLLNGQSVPFKQYTIHDGLPQSQISSIFQDSRGYIWVGTQSGLAYFDGVKFHNLKISGGIAGRSILHFQEDIHGNIWFNTGRWFYKYDGNSITYDTTLINILPVDGHFFIDNYQRSWCINREDGYLYSSQDFIKWDCVSHKEPSLRNKQWRQIVYDRKEERILLKDYSEILYSWKNDKLTPLLSGEIVSLRPYISNRNELTYGSINNSFFELKNDSIIFPNELRGIPMRDVNRRANGKILYTTPQANHLCILDNTGNIDTIPLNISSIRLIFEDRDKNIWLGTEEGIIRIFSEGFYNFDTKYLKSEWSMVEDKSGSMWFGSFFNPDEIRIFDGIKITSKKVNYKIKPDKDKTPGLFGNFYFGGSRDTKGNLYFPMNWGIMKFDGNKFSAFGNPQLNTEISLNVYLDTVKNIIISSTTGGVNVFDIETGETKYFDVWSKLPGFAHVLSVGKGKGGNFWLCLLNGVACLDLGKEIVTKIYSQKLNNFPYYLTTSIKGDHNDNIWIGTAQGLLYFDEKNDTFLLVAPHIIKSSVMAITEYKDKYLVIGSIDGIYFLDLNAFYNEDGKTIIRHFNQHNGYLGIEPNQNCLYVDSKDNIWVSASDIVTKIIPAELNMNPSPLKLYITEINNERIRYEDYKKTISLPYGVNSVKIRFEAVGFDRPSVTEYSYKTGNGNWSEWLAEDFAILDNLSSGTYSFFVRTRPAGTVDENEIEETSIQFKISVPLHKEFYFPYLVAVGFILLSGGIWHYVQKAQSREVEVARQHQKYIEKQEQLASENNRKIKYLQIQTLLAQLNPHFIFNVLEGIQSRIYDGSREVASGLIVGLSNLIRRFLESSVNMNLSKISNSDITLQQEIELLNLYIKFEQFYRNNKFDYGIQVAEDLSIENIFVPPMLIQPYVENAIKYGMLYVKDRRCRVDISFLKTIDDKLVCFIKDNGVGRLRAREIQRQYIPMFKSRGTGLLEERIKIMQELGHGISVFTEDNPEGGTIVKLEIDM